MLFKVIATGSSMNSYAIIDDQGNTLIIEAAISHSDVIANTRETKKYCGYIYSHGHSDHYRPLIAKKYEFYFPAVVERFTVISFNVDHDFFCKNKKATKNKGYVIQTICNKTIFFATDFFNIDSSILSELSQFNFDLIVIEVSYNNFIFRDLDEQIKDQLRNHCSDDYAVHIVKQIESNKNTPILTIHKSERGARAGMITTKFAAAGYNNVRVAVAGTVIKIGGNND